MRPVQRDAAAATLEVNEATVLSSEADLRLAEVNLSKAKIVSPIDGVILTRDVDPARRWHRPECAGALSPSPGICAAWSFRSRSMRRMSAR